MIARAVDAVPPLDLSDVTDTETKPIPRKVRKSPGKSPGKYSDKESPARTNLQRKGSKKIRKKSEVNVFAVYSHFLEICEIDLRNTVILNK